MDTTVTLSAEAKTFYDRELLERAKAKLQLFGFSKKSNLKKNTGTAVEWRRFEAISDATTPLVEGITPVGSSLSVSTVTGTAAQYGNFVTISDKLDLLGFDPVMTEAAGVLGQNAGESIEEIVKAEVVTGTQVVYATGTARTDQVAASPITIAKVRSAVRTLEVNDAPKFDGERMENGQGGLYGGWIHPRQWHDLKGDSAVQNTFTYSDPEKFYKQRVEILEGVAWMISTRAPKFTGGGSGGVDVYGAVIFGKDSFGTVDVAGTGKFQTIAKQLGSGGTSDPLDQRATQGWKSWQLPKILNNNFFIRVESGVSA